jgi:AcrR family transcriptional regulator
MPQVCTVCTHRKRKAIERDIVDGGTIRDIGARYGVSSASVQRHKRDHLARALAEGVVQEPKHSEAEPTQIIREQVRRNAEAEAAHVVDIFHELYDQLTRLGRLYDALDLWLRDPDDANRYSIDPRAHEIQVVYLDWNETNQSGDPKRKKAKLTDLLDRIHQGTQEMAEPIISEARFADPREMLVKVSAELRQQMALRVQILEKVTSAEEIEAFMNIVLDAVDEVAPDVRRCIEHRIRERRPVRSVLGPYGGRGGPVAAS